MAKPLPSTQELKPHILVRAWQQGLTASTLQRVVAQKREGYNFLTIAIGLNLPTALVENAYNRLPANLR